MATYSINSGTPYQSTYLGNLDPNLFLNLLPNNTSQLIFPEDVRDAVYTIWDNVTFKQVMSASSSIPYIGIDGMDQTSKYLPGEDGLKLLLGKPYLSGVDTLSDDLINYSSGDSDVIVYNFKPDDYNGSASDQQFTKMSFLAGDNSNDLFLTAPYLKSQQNIGGTAIDFTIYNEGGSITIDSQDELIIGSPNTKVTLLYGTGSTGIATLPGGLNGDVQLNLDNCEFGFVSGASSSVGDVLIMGASNSPYWGSLSINSVFTLNQILTSGNTTDGNDMIITNNDMIYVGATGGTYMSINYNGVYHNIDVPNSEFRISTSNLKLNIPGMGSTKVLFTDGSGYAYWATQSFATIGGSNTNVQYNNNGVFAGTGLLNWKSISSSLEINNPNGTSSVSIKPNIQGGLHIDTDNSSNVLHITDGTSSVFKIDNLNKSIILDSGSDHDVTFGGTSSFNKYTFHNGNTLNGMSFVGNLTDEFRMLYQTGTGVKSSMISHSPDDSLGMFLGVIDTHDDALYIGSYDVGLGTYEANIVSYPTSSTMSVFMSRSVSKSVVIGNSDKGLSIAGSLISSQSDKKSLGINITPELDFHLNGVRGITPISRSLDIISTGKTLSEVSSSYITLNDSSDLGSNIYRWGDYTGELVSAYGTTIEVWNRTGGDINIHILNSQLVGSYDTNEKRNIYFSDITNNPSIPTYDWKTGTMLRFVYLSCDILNGGDMYTNLISISGGQLIGEGGVWYKVD